MQRQSSYEKNHTTLNIFSIVILKYEAKLLMLYLPSFTCRLRINEAIIKLSIGTKHNFCLITDLHFLFMMFAENIE